MPDGDEGTGTAGDDEVRALRALASRLHVGEVSWEQPPADLWDRIATESGVATSTPPPASTVVDDPGSRAAAPANPVDPVLGAHSRGAVPIGRASGRGGRRATPWLLAAAAAVVLVVASVAFVNRRTSDITVLASTPLKRLGPTGSGDAELVRKDGELRLRVRTAGVTPGTGFLEVWVIDARVRRLVSLGPARADGVYDLPRRLDPKQFPIVDVSVEPLDGNPAHSSDSVLRGRLRF